MEIGNTKAVQISSSKNEFFASAIGKNYTKLTSANIVHIVFSLLVFFNFMVVGLISMQYGLTLGFPTTNLAILMSDEETPLAAGKITMEEASWFASLLSVGGFINNIIFGLIASKLSRKKMCLFISILTIVREHVCSIHKMRIIFLHF